MDACFFMLLLVQLYFIWLFMILFWKMLLELMARNATFV